MSSQHETIQFRPRAAKASPDAAEQRRKEYGVRPAVMEHKPKGLLKRLPVPEVKLPQVSLPSSPAARRAIVVLGFLAIVVVFLYGPVRSLYAATRDEQVYTAQLAELNASNAELRAEVDRLQSREGIEDEARKRGYVLPGEQPVMVEGLEVDDRGTADSSASAVQSRSDDNPWYIDVLDFIFSYEAPEFVSK